MSANLIFLEMYAYPLCSLSNAGASLKKVLFHSGFMISKTFDTENVCGDWFRNVLLLGPSVASLKGNNSKESSSSSL